MVFDINDVAIPDFMFDITDSIHREHCDRKQNYDCCSTSCESMRIYPFVCLLIGCFFYLNFNESKNCF